MLVPGIVVILAFLSGIGFGLFMGSFFPSSSATEDGGTNNQAVEAGGSGAQTESQTDAALNSRIQELENELVEQRNGEAALILQDRLAFFKKHHEGLDLEAFDGNLKISPAMADILGLTKEEEQVVEQHMAQIKNEVDQYEDANMTLVKQSANSVTFEVPANPGGEALQAKLSGLVSSDISSDRAELITQDIDQYPYSALSAFDKYKKQVEINWVDQNGSPFYTIKESDFGPNGSLQSVSLLNAKNSLPPRYAKFLQAESGQ